MKRLLYENKIELFSCIPLSSCKVYKKYLLEKAGLDEDSSVIIMLLPYRSKHTPKNLSVYASVRDYHKFTDGLRTQVKEFFKKEHPFAKVELFADHSPIDEVHAACIGGLGFIGDNGLLINEKYSSFVFLCEIITDLSPAKLGLEYNLSTEVKRCYGCGACHRACPSNCMDENDPRPKSECLSAITQKKGILTPDEIKMMLKYGSIWGCDVCQNVCPYTKNAEYTPIDFFDKEVITTLTSELINGMSDEEFLSRPFSWRGREVILRNTKIYEDSLKK
ncbi:MAG: epoxyqueuosine reductase [Clostridia bacterium]|nr:epoxyqueuosine reductase [Clostridia bacterium]